MLLDWLRPSEVIVGGGAYGLGSIRGGPFPFDVVASVTSGFDPNRPPVTVNGVTGPWGHYAVDAAAGAGTPIICVGDGVVFFVQRAGGGISNTLLVNHQNGWISAYAHMLDYPPFLVGDRISNGDAIGVEDTTGVATGPHLHFELRWNNVGMDPLTALLIGPDLAPTAQPISVPQAGEVSPELTLNMTQQLQALLGNGTVVFPAYYTTADGTERYISIKDGIPRLLPAGALTRGYSVYVPLEVQP